MWQVCFKQSEVELQSNILEPSLTRVFSCVWDPLYVLIWPCGDLLLLLSFSVRLCLCYFFFLLLAIVDNLRRMCTQHNSPKNIPYLSSPCRGNGVRLARRINIKRHNSRDACLRPSPRSNLDLHAWEPDGKLPRTLSTII